MSLADPELADGQTVDITDADSDVRDVATPHLSQVDAQLRRLMQKTAPPARKGVSGSDLPSAGAMDTAVVSPEGQVAPDAPASGTAMDGGELGRPSASALKPVDDLPTTGAPVSGNLFAGNIRNPHFSVPVVVPTKDDAYASAGHTEEVYHW